MLDDDQLDESSVAQKQQSEFIFVDRIYFFASIDYDLSREHLRYIFVIIGSPGGLDLPRS